MDRVGKVTIVHNMWIDSLVEDPGAMVSMSVKEDTCCQVSQTYIVMFSGNCMSANKSLPAPAGKQASRPAGRQAGRQASS